MYQTLTSSAGCPHTHTLEKTPQSSLSQGRDGDPALLSERRSGLRCGIGSIGPRIAQCTRISRSRNSSERIQLLYNAASMTVSDTVGPCRPRCRPCLDSLADVTPRDSTILRDPTIAAIPRHIFGLSLGVLHSMWHWDVAMHWCGEPQCGRCEPYRGPAGPA